MASLPIENMPHTDSATGSSLRVPPRGEIPSTQQAFDAVFQTKLEPPASSQLDESFGSTVEESAEQQTPSAEVREAELGAQPRDASSERAAEGENTSEREHNHSETNATDGKQTQTEDNEVASSIVELTEEAVHADIPHPPASQAEVPQATVPQDPGATDGIAPTPSDRPADGSPLPGGETVNVGDKQDLNAPTAASAEQTPSQPAPGEATHEATVQITAEAIESGGEGDAAKSGAGDRGDNGAEGEPNPQGKGPAIKEAGEADANGPSTAQTRTAEESVENPQAVESAATPDDPDFSPDVDVERFESKPQKTQTRGDVGAEVTDPGESASSTTPVTDATTSTKQNANERLGNQVFGPTTATPNSDLGKDAQQARLVGRISRAFQSAQLRGGPLRIRLHPSELGSLSIELQLENGALNAKLEVENQAARTAILENLPNLRERLSEQGVRVEQFEVELTGEGDGKPTDLAEQHKSEQRETEEAPSVDSSGESNSEDSEAQSPPTQDGGLNVIV